MRNKIFGNVNQNFAISTTKLFEVSLKWWMSFRPKGYTVVRYLEYPCINIKRKEDKELGIEIAFILKNEVME